MSKIKRTMLIVVAGVVILSLVIAGCAAPAPTPTAGEPIKVGVCGPFSGPAAPYGLSFKRPTEMWADEINAEGGLLVDGVRHPIEVYAEDTRMDAAYTKTAVERLVYEYKVRYIMGPPTPEELKVMLPISEPEKVVIFTGSPGPFGSDHPYLIEAISLPNHFVFFVFKYLMETEGVKSVYLLTVNNDTGLWCQGVDLTAAEDLGLEVLVPDATFEPDTTDFYPVASKAIAVNPDVICVAFGAATEWGLFAKSARELGFKKRIISDCSPDVETVMSVAGEYAEGLMWQAGMPPNPTPKLFKYIDDYRARYGVWNEEAGRKMVSAWMIGATIQAAGEAAITDTDAFVAAMPKVAWPDPYIEGNPLITYTGGRYYNGWNCIVGVPMISIISFR